MRRHVARSFGLWLYTLLRSPLLAIAPPSIRNYFRAMGAMIWVYGIGGVAAIVGVVLDVGHIVRLPAWGRALFWLVVLLVLIAAPFLAYSRLLKRCERLDAALREESHRKDVRNALARLYEQGCDIIESANDDNAWIRSLDGWYGEVRTRMLTSNLETEYEMIQEGSERYGVQFNGYRPWVKAREMLRHRLRRLRLVLDRN